MHVLHPETGQPVDVADHPVEAGLVRLSVLGADGFELDFDEPRVVEALAACVGPGGGESPFAPAALRPHAERGLAALEQAAQRDGRLQVLLGLWRARALALAGRADDAPRDEAHRERLRARLEEIAAARTAAEAAGDEATAEALHARYIELGTQYAGRLAQLWAADGPEPLG